MRLLTISEASRLTGISRQSIYTYIDDHELEEDTHYTRKRGGRGYLLTEGAVTELYRIRNRNIRRRGKRNG